jgi:hypothetical protein
MTAEMKKALAKAKRKFMDRKTHPEVTGVAIGLKKVGGVRTDKAAIVFSVKKKLKRAEVAPGQILPQSIDGEITDVIQSGEIKAERAPRIVDPQELRQRRRPCPPGYSIGHYSITAGTLGAWVRRDDDGFHILSNNHVLAASNAGVIGDWIIQPGKADDGSITEDKFAQLEKFVAINFEEKGKKAAAAYWRAAKWLPNILARLTGCPYRLVVQAETRGVPQQTPNLVDAALAAPLSQGLVSFDTPFVGPISGFADMRLGDAVQKVGRTTDYTFGQVVGTDGMFRVNYGKAGTAVFDDQAVIEGTDGDFSAGGDSGSAILNSDNAICGLLFAGGEGMTIANKMSHVVTLLEVRF